MRETNIKLSNEEKDLLDKYAKLKYGQGVYLDIPYGTLVSELASPKIKELQKNESVRGAHGDS